MSILAHTTLAAPGFDAEKRAMAATAQHEVGQAKHIQKQTGCTWTEALRSVRPPDVCYYTCPHNKGLNCRQCWPTQYRSVK